MELMFDAPTFRNGNPDAPQALALHHAVQVSCMENFHGQLLLLP